MTGPPIELTYPLIARAAADAEVRCLFIKGPFLEQQGLRGATRSVDIDVWVAPAEFERFLAAVESAGWQPFHDLPGHAATLRHPGFSHELDVHHAFPGSRLPDEAAFEVVWAQRTEATIAGQTVLIPALPAHAVLAVLHLMRPPIGAVRPDRAERSRREWRELVEASAAIIDEIQVCAVQWRVDHVVEPFLRQVSGREPIELPGTDAWPDNAPQDGAGVWIGELVAARPSRKSAVIKSALWPSELAIRQDDAKHGRVARPLWWARARRLGRGMIRTPRAVWRRR